MVKKVICVCKCPGESEVAAKAYLEMFNSPLPDILVGRSQILKLAEECPKCEIALHARALARNKDKYAYCFEYTEDGMVTKKVNLLTKQEVL